MRRCFIVLVFMLFSLCFGCGPKAPEGFPRVYPCTITVNKEGKPLVDAAVTLLPETKGTGAWAIAGMTGADGVAAISTVQSTYTARGVPEGKYKVTVTKVVLPEGRLSDEEIKKMPPPERMKYAAAQKAKMDKMPPVVPPVLHDSEKTPLTIEITSAGGELTIDVDQF